MSSPIKGLFEAHISVGDRSRALSFYQRVVGLELAVDLPSRDAAFLWVGERGNGMLGLWGPECVNAPISRGKSHFAMQTTLDYLKTVPEKLKAAQVQPLDFDGKPTSEPVVLAWMPAASVYFKDCDGHSVEYITMLEAPARAELGILPLSAWEKVWSPVT